MCPIHFTRLKEGDVGHFDGIGSNNGFFGYGYFCLKHYNNKGKYWCQTTCNVCCNDHCISGIERSCRYCHRTCRSLECYQRHANRTDTRGPESEKSSCENVGIAEKYWKSLKGNPKITVVVNGNARIRPTPVLSAQTCHASQEESYNFCFLRLRNDTKRNDIV